MVYSLKVVVNVDMCSYYSLDYNSKRGCLYEQHPKKRGWFMSWLACVCPSWHRQAQPTGSGEQAGDTM